MKRALILAGLLLVACAATLRPPLASPSIDMVAGTCTAPTDRVDYRVSWGAVAHTPPVTGYPWQVRMNGVAVQSGTAGSAATSVVGDVACPAAGDSAALSARVRSATADTVSAWGNSNSIILRTPAPAPVVASVVATPSSHAFTAIGATRQASAVARDASGNVVPGTTFAWTSTATAVATVSASGLITSTGAGSAGVIVSAAGRADTIPVTVTLPIVPPPAPVVAIDTIAGVTPPVEPPVQPPPSGFRANEPQGWTRVTERPFSALNEDGWRIWDSGGEGTSGFSVVSMNGPQSPSSVGRARFRAGYGGGRSPVHVEKTGWTSRSVYIQFQFMLSPNWQNHSSGVNKILFLVDASTGNAGDPMYFSAQGEGSNRFSFEPREQGGPGGARNYSWDASDNQVSPTLAQVDLGRGRWNNIEALMIGNTSGQNNGEVHVWTNGVKTHQFRGVAFLGSGSAGFNNIQWQPVWGGTGGSVSSEMYQYIDHFYVSRP